MNLRNPTVLGLAALLTVIGTVLALTHTAQPTPQATPSAWVAGWQVLQPFTQPRRALAATAYGDYVYVLGGINDQDRYVRAVEYAPLHPDGTLGAWRITAPLQVGRFYLGTAAVNGWLYALGGATGPRGDDNAPVATIERAHINADGSLAPWEIVADLSTPRRGLKVVAAGHFIYAIGGYNGAFLTSTERAAVQANGELGAWEVERETSKIDRYIHAVAHDGAHIYLVGGHMRNPQQMSYGDVESTRLQADGHLAPWRIAASILRTPRFIATAFALNGYLYMAGGHDGARRLDSVEISRLDAQGQPGPWSLTTPLPTGRSAAAVLEHRGQVYMLGGADDRGALAEVITASAGPRGTLGHTP